jgi:hypothetical protein
MAPPPRAANISQGNPARPVFPCAPPALPLRSTARDSGQPHRRGREARSAAGNPAGPGFSDPLQRIDFKNSTFVFVRVIFVRRSSIASIGLTEERARLSLWIFGSSSAV